MKLNRLLTSAELAERLRYSVWHIRELARTGVLPSVRLHKHGRLLFDEEAVREALSRTARAETRS